MQRLVYHEIVIRKCCIGKKLDHLACKCNAIQGSKQTLIYQFNGFIEGRRNFKFRKLSLQNFIKIGWELTEKSAKNMRYKLIWRRV